MSKRFQEGTREERIVAKSRPTMNLASQTVPSCSTASSSSTSISPGILKASCQGLILTARTSGGALQLKIQTKMTQRRVLKRGNLMLNEPWCEETCHPRKQTKTWIFQRARWNLRPKVQTSSSSTSTQNGQTNTRCLPHPSHILRRSTQTCDWKCVANQETVWTTSIRTRWYGDCLCLLLWTLQFTFGYITWRICTLPKIKHNER